MKDEMKPIKVKSKGIPIKCDPAVVDALTPLPIPNPQALAPICLACGATLDRGERPDGKLKCVACGRTYARENVNNVGRRCMKPKGNAK